MKPSRLFTDLVTVLFFVSIAMGTADSSHTRFLCWVMAGGYACFAATAVMEWWFHRKAHARIHRAFPAFLALCLLIPLTGCPSTPARDPANQTAIDHRQAVADLRAGYASTERLITSLHRTGTISTDRATMLVRELQGTVRPLIQATQDAIVNGDFDAAILRATEALGNVTTKTKATAQTRPS